MPLSSRSSIASILANEDARFNSSSSEYTLCQTRANSSKVMLVPFTKSGGRSGFSRVAAATPVRSIRLGTRPLGFAAASLAAAGGTASLVDLADVASVRPASLRLRFVGRVVDAADWSSNSRFVVISLSGRTHGAQNNPSARHDTPNCTFRAYGFFLESLPMKG